MSNNIGRLKHTLKEKCEECKKPLQIRVKIDGGREIEYKYCFTCDSEVGRPVKIKDYPNAYKEGEFA